MDSNEELESLLIWKTQSKLQKEDGIELGILWSSRFCTASMNILFREDKEEAPQLCEENPHQELAGQSLWQQVDEGILWKKNWMEKYEKHLPVKGNSTCKGPVAGEDMAYDTFKDVKES
ncbi:uncharacterized protein LOC143669143 isoform X1 [Tamandua tetradactyla]|uniref:uncharacterized protein LOC143669143 isoform X1 n=1 Tax=Tamandua tetradactyla TaxID=48850 RepID=UPI004054850C